MSEKLSRREFVQTSTAAATVALGAAPAFGQAPAVRTGGVAPVVIASDNGNIWKNGGARTTVQLAFESQFTRFGNLAKEDRMPERYE